MDDQERERVYGQDEYYWGTKPNQLARRTLNQLTTENGELTVVDIGAGEGRDAVFFAERGLSVYAVDVSSNGLAKARRLADERSVEVETLRADANTLTLSRLVDIVYSAGTVQYIEPANRQHQFEHFRQQTTPGGLHTIFAFVDHPDVPTPPDWTANEFFYEPGELEDYYDEWAILDLDRVIFEDDSGDMPHEHAAEIIMAEKPN